MSEDREVELCGMRLPYLNGYRSQYGVRFLTTKVAAIELDRLVIDDDHRTTMLRATDNGGTLADVGSVWIEDIGWLVNGDHGEVTLRFRL